MENTILFAIVTYKEKYFNCLSYVSLVKSFRKYGKDKMDIFIFDNTDLNNWNVLVSEQENINVTYFHQRDNRGISYAYNRINEFALKNNFKWIVFLDQDTSLPINTYEIYLNKVTTSPQHLIAVPSVYANNKIISPSKYILYRSVLMKKGNSELMDLKEITCINSGLIISSNFYKSVGGYNENLKLDFCDHEFIERVKLNIKYLQILNMDFFQDLSSHNNNIDQAIFRYKIFVADLKNYSNSKNKILLFLRIDLPHLLKLTYKYKSLFFIKFRLDFLV